MVAANFTNLGTASHRSISYQCRFPEVRDIVWVDTVGLDDADLEDDSTFKDILRFINDNSLFNVKGIQKKDIKGT